MEKEKLKKQIEKLKEALGSIETLSANGGGFRLDEIFKIAQKALKR